jgi:uncharacterized protein (TIRG00374 family)
MKSRRFLTTQAILLAVAAGLLWLAVRNVSWQELRGLLAAFNWSSLWLLIVLDLGMLVSLTARWWFVLDGFRHRIPFLRLMRYRTAVFGLSYITPGPQVGGEVLQVYFPAARHDVPTAVSLATATVDKTLDFLGTFTFLAIGVFAVFIGQHLITEVSTPALLAVLPLLLIPGALIVRIWRGRHPISGMVLWVERLVPKAWRTRLRAHRWFQGVPSLHRFHTTTFHSEELIAWLCRTRPYEVLAAVCMTALAWVFTYAEFWVMAHALNLPLNRAQVLATMSLMYFALLMPLPGGLGAVEAALVLALTSFGYSPTQAISLSLLIRTRDLIAAGIGLLLGGMGGWRSRTGPPALAGEREAAAPGEVQSADERSASLARSEPAATPH